MATTKYGHFIKKLNYEKVSGSDMGRIFSDYLVWPKGKDLEGINLNFVWGYFGQAGRWSEGGTHTHPTEECVIVTGLDYDNPGELGAEIEIEIGPEAEKYVLDAPAIFALPRGFPHSPPMTSKVNKPFGVLAIGLNGEHRTSHLPGKSGQASSSEMKYGHLAKRMEMRKTTRNMGGNADFIAAWSGKNMEGFKLNFTWAFHSRIGAWHGGKDPHTHPTDEALLFVGLGPERPDYLGAEIEIAMGKEQEKHVFDYPAVVVAPVGFVHCPLITRRVDKPYAFSAISLNTEHQTTWLGTGKFPWEE